VSIEVEIETLRMSDGTVADVPTGGITAFVGPNNAGKSLALRNIRDQLATTPATEPRAIVELEIKREGSEEQLQQWLDTHCHRQGSGAYATYGRFGSMNSSNTFSNLLSGWLDRPLSGLGSFFTYFGNGETRLQAANPGQMINFRREPNTQPLHYLYRDESLEARLSGIAKQAFGVGLILDRWAGTELPLQVGDLSRPRFDSAMPPQDYLDSLAALPPLQSQGDGMKSFVGILLNLIAAEYFFVLIDEPEAFLHPPQAQLLGQMLASEKAPGMQIFLATHSSDVLRGLLDSSASDLTIVRLTHEGDINPTSVLDANGVRELWQDPLLRYSNILDGLFNEAVILLRGGQ
jgi:AAA domain, putative AbiEii toxin, Type IV TA system